MTDAGGPTRRGFWRGIALVFLVLAALLAAAEVVFCRYSLWHVPALRPTRLAIEIAGGRISGHWTTPEPDGSISGWGPRKPEFSDSGEWTIRLLPTLTTPAKQAPSPGRVPVLSGIPIVARFFTTVTTNAISVSVPIWLMAVVCAIASWRAWRRSCRVPAGICRACGYAVLGLGMCPECGEPTKGRSAIHARGAS